VSYDKLYQRPRTLEKELEEVTSRYISMICCPYSILIAIVWILG